MKNEDLDRLEAFHKESTSGKWKHVYTANNAGMPLADFYIPRHNGGAKVEMLADDAAFICEAHAQVPALLAEVRRLQAENADLREKAADAKRVGMQIVDDPNEETTQ